MEVQQVMVRTAERRGEKVAEMRQQREVPLPGLPLIPILLGMEVPEIRHR
jgi:hypothetical protein